MYSQIKILVKNLNVFEHNKMNNKTRRPNPGTSNKNKDRISLTSAKFTTAPVCSIKKMTHPITTHFTAIKIVLTIQKIQQSIVTTKIPIAIPIHVQNEELVND
jgi:hypothetical protein